MYIVFKMIICVSSSSTRCHHWFVLTMVYAAASSDTKLWRTRSCLLQWQQLQKQYTYQQYPLTYARHSLQYQLTYAIWYPFTYARRPIISYSISKSHQQTYSDICNTQQWHALINSRCQNNALRYMQDDANAYSTTAASSNLQNLFSPLASCGNIDFSHYMISYLDINNYGLCL